MAENDQATFDRSFHVKKAIRDAATELFARDGYAATGIRDIAAQAGSDPALVIRHFGSKEALFLATMEEVMGAADVVIATTGRPGLIEPRMIREGQVILALTNPDPEIEPELAEASGAAFAADGRSVNNVLGYPGIFRGALMAGASAINLEMKLAAARVLADLAEGDELVPDVLLQEVHDAVARAVMEAAEHSGVARPEMVAVGL